MALQASCEMQLGAGGRRDGQSFSRIYAIALLDVDHTAAGLKGLCNGAFVIHQEMTILPSAMARRAGDSDSAYMASGT